jgi:hypothetical protein
MNFLGLYVKLSAIVMRQGYHVSRPCASLWIANDINYNVFNKRLLTGCENS